METTFVAWQAHPGLRRPLMRRVGGQLTATMHVHARSMNMLMMILLQIVTIGRLKTKQRFGQRKAFEGKKRDTPNKNFSRLQELSPKRPILTHRKSMYKFKITFGPFCFGGVHFLCFFFAEDRVCIHSGGSSTRTVVLPNRYEVLEWLGTGSGGTVWCACQYRCR